MGLRRLAVLPFLVGCSFHVSATSDQPPDTPIVFDDGGNQFGWLKRDTAAEFGEAGGTLAEIAIEARPTSDVLTPAAYRRGAVLARGLATCPFASAAAIDFTTLASGIPSGAAFVEAATVDVAAIPAGVQVMADQSWAYWIEGELQLSAGAHALAIRADDFGAFEIAPPDTRTFARVFTGDFTLGVVTSTFNGPVTGWYPFRAMICQTNGGGASLQVTLDTATITTAKLRARADTVRGTIVTGWNGTLFSRPAVGSIVSAPFLADNLDTPPPGSTDHNLFSARWAGQLRIDVPGTYTFRADTDDGNRLQVGGVTVDMLSSFASSVVSDVTVPLRAGWIPITVDYNQGGSNAHADLRLIGAPSGVATNATIPPAQLRPVEAAGARVATFDDSASAAIPNNANTPINRTWSPVSTGETITDLWLSYRFIHGMPAEIEIRLVHPDGTTKLVRAGDSNGTSPAFLRIGDFNGKPLAGAIPWRLEVKDTGGGQTGTLQGFSLTAFTTGGQSPIAPVATWTSATAELNAVVIDLVHFVAETPAGSTAKAWVRTCDATPCDTEPWTGPYADGDAVTAAPKRYAQLKVELSATTDAEATLDSIELQYRFRP